LEASSDEFSVNSEFVKLYLTELEELLAGIDYSVPSSAETVIIPGYPANSWYYLDLVLYSCSVTGAAVSNSSWIWF